MQAELAPPSLTRSTLVRSGGAILTAGYDILKYHIITLIFQYLMHYVYHKF